MSVPSLTPNRSLLAEQDREQLLSTARRLLAETEALSSRIAAVSEIGLAMNRTFDLDEILLVVARQAKWLLDFDHCSVCLQVEGNRRQFRTLFGLPVESENTDWIVDTEIGFVLKTGQSRLIRDADPTDFFHDYPSQIILPLTSGNNLIGTINFFRRLPLAYTQEDLRVGYLLALQLSSAIRNAEHFREMKRAEDELRRYASELEARNRELDAYSHTIAHDLKTPLTAILVKTFKVGRLAGDQLPEEARRSLADVESSVKNMGQMIDQLLWLAALRDATAVAVVVDVQATVKIALSRYQEAIARDHIGVEVAELPLALGHAQWIEEVFANLIGNAIKYMGHDNPNRQIHICGFRQAGMMRYEVRDTGIGIAPEDQARLFDMFTRLHAVDAEGLGLGLSIVQRIVSRLMGVVGIESIPGQGSTFWFTLPAPQ